MRSIRNIFILTGISITFLMHIFVFGDAGYMMYSHYEKELNRLEDDIHELKSENQRLNEKYMMIMERRPSKSPVVNDEETESEEDTGEAIILKFDGIALPDDPLTQKLEEKEKSYLPLIAGHPLPEIRRFILITGLILTFLGTMLIQTQIKESIKTS